MRSIALGTILVLSLAVLSLSAPANASPIGRLSDLYTLAPPAPAAKPVVVKRAVNKQAAKKRAVEYVAVPAPWTVAATNPQPKKFVAAKHQSRKAITPPTQNNFFLPWQTWTGAVANQKPKTQTRARVTRAAYIADPSIPVTQYAHRADISSDFSQQYAPQYTRQSISRRAAQPKSGVRMPALFASSDIVSEARRWIGTNPTNMNRVWCARFMNFVLERAGYSGTGSDAANSFAFYGRRVLGPQVGAIAVMTRGRNGGHVGVVSGIDSSGNPIVISGNHGRKVGEGVYSRARIYAYVRPI